MERRCGQKSVLNCRVIKLKNVYLNWRFLNRRSFNIIDF